MQNHWYCCIGPAAPLKSSSYYIERQGSCSMLGWRSRYWSVSKSKREEWMVPWLDIFFGVVPVMARTEKGKQARGRLPWHKRGRIHSRMFCAENIELCGRMMTKSSDSEVDTDYNSQSQAILVACTSEERGRSIMLSLAGAVQRQCNSRLDVQQGPATGARQRVAAASMLWEADSEDWQALQPDQTHKRV